MKQKNISWIHVCLSLTKGFLKDFLLFCQDLKKILLGIIGFHFVYNCDTYIFLSKRDIFAFQSCKG